MYSIWTNNLCLNKPTCICNHLVLETSWKLMAPTYSDQQKLQHSIAVLIEKNKNKKCILKLSVSQLAVQKLYADHKCLIYHPSGINQWLPVWLVPLGWAHAMSAKAIDWMCFWAHWDRQSQVSEADCRHCSSFQRSSGDAHHQRADVGFLPTIHFMLVLRLKWKI